MSSKPNCILLNDPRQMTKWLAFQGFIDGLPGRYDEETACMESSYTWTAFGSGIGDTLYVKAMGYICHLEIDDDNEISEGWKKCV
jgi:hypothetical protein